MRRRTVTILAVAVAALALGPAAQVFAHADYDHSTPNAGETVTTVPTQVDVFFTQEVDPAGANGLNVTNADGADVDNNDATIDATDGTHMWITLQANLPNGTYTVAWNSTSLEDGDTDEGTFTFAIDAAQAEPTDEPTTEPSPEATTAPTGQLPTSGTGDGLGGSAGPILPLLVVALGGGGLLWLGATRLRRQL
jgi:methionine-rich copper-binding protein CopC